MRRRSLELLLLVPASLSVCAAQTQPTLNVLHSFTGTPDGYYPENGVIVDNSGNLFGSTSSGGTYNSGFVYELSPPTAGATTWAETGLYSFPASGVLGGYLQSPLWLTPPADGMTAWTGSVLLSFMGQDVTGYTGPVGSLLADGVGNRYGVTETLGTFNCGTVYKLSAPTEGNASGTYTVLYNFTCGNDGGYPWDGVVSDGIGNLYGTTNKFGAFGAGVVYKLSPPSAEGGAWTETPIYTFTGGADGAGPGAKAVFGANGSLYGTTYGNSQPNTSVVFELTPPALNGGAWTESVLHTFSGRSDGTSPHAPLISDGGQGFYGTAMLGDGGRHNYGTLFHLQPPAEAGGTWTLAPLYQFTGGSDGALPTGDLLLVHGNLYGVTQGLGIIPGSVYCWSTSPNSTCTR